MAKTDLDGNMWSTDTPATTFSIPEPSDWECELFGTGPHGMRFRPNRGDEPNWFWRLMQYLILGNRWVKRPQP